MFEELKEIPIGSMLSIDDPEAIQFTEYEDYRVIGVEVYSHEESGELVILDLDGFYLIVHTFQGSPRYHLYELSSSGYEEDLNKDGFRLVFREENMPKFIIVGRNTKENAYKNLTGSISGLILERNENNSSESDHNDITISEYRGKSKTMTHIFLQKNDDNFTLFQGIKIDKGTIIL